MDKIELKDIRVYEEDGSYFLSLTYEVEDDREVRQLDFHKVRLGIRKYDEPTVELTSDECYIRFNGGHLYRALGVDTDEGHNVYCSVKILSEKPTKMTVSEIEKELGYKIEIVSEKENDES